MPYLSKKRVWTQQPDRLLPLDPAVMHEESSLVLLPGVNVPATRVSPLGREIHAADNYYYTDKAPIAQANALTLVMCGRVTSAVMGVFSRWFSVGGYGVGSGIDIQQYTGSEYTIVYSPGLVHLADKNWMDVEIGLPHTWVAVLNASTVSFYRDGKSIWSGAATTAPADTGKVSLFSTPESPGNNRSDNCGLSLFAVDFGHALGPSEALALSSNAFKIFSPQDRRIWIPSAGGGGVHTTTSILTSDVATISGTSLHKILHTVVGNLTSSAATLTGTSVHTTPSPTHNTVGVLSASNSSITGIAARYREHQTTGILTTTNATINGTTNNFSVITSTGVLSSNVATLAGVMSITPAPGIHISTGVLQSNSSTITGILTHTATGHTLTGTLVSSVATLNGNVAHNTIHSSSGTLVSNVATINGTTSSSGVITLTPADIEAIANAVWQHPWALTLPKWLALK